MYAVKYNNIVKMIPETIAKIKQGLFSGFRSLPIALAVTTFIFAFMQTNVAFILLFVGLAIIVPISTTLTNLVLDFILSKTSLSPSMWQVPVSAACTIVGSPAPIFGVPTFWMSSIVFFFTYITLNGISLYNREADEAADKNKVLARKSQALIGIILSVIIGIACIIGRILLMGCETGVGVFAALITMIPLAIGWYNFGTECGITDIFGIANGLLPMSAKANAAYVCVNDI